MSPRLHSLADLASLFGPDAKAPVTKNGGSAEAGRREEQAMEQVALSAPRSKVIPARDEHDVRAVERARFERWVSQKIAQSQGGPVTENVVLTPTLAVVLLEHNPDNRSVNALTVERYARDISTRRWSFNGQTLVVSLDGSLNDGQHRCHAVIKAGVSINTLIVFGAERDTRFTLDQGKPRTTGDYLAMQGRHDSISYAAIANYIWQYRNHKKLSSQQYARATKAEVLSVVDSHPEIADSMSAVPSTGVHTLGGRSLLAFCHWVFARRAGREAANAFLVSLVTGAGLGSNDPILYVRNRLIASAGRLKANEKAELIFRGWNSHRRRSSPTTLPIKNELLPAVED